MRACPAHGRLVSRISVGTEGELKEYTYVMENRDMPKTVLEDVDTETWRFGWWNVVGFLFGMLTCQVKNHGSPEHEVVKRVRDGDYSYLWPQ